jgi:DNA-binding CsgD family transcriptional regulator
MLALAAGVGFSTGDARVRDEVRRLVRSTAPYRAQWQLYSLAATDAASSGAELEAALVEFTAGMPPDVDLGTLRGIALAHWHLDRPIAAGELLRQAVDRMRARSEVNHLPLLLVLLGFTELWRGRWLDAQSLGADGARLAGDVGQPLIRASGHALLALVAAVRGETDRVAAEAAAAASASDEAFPLAVTIWARGLSALGDGRLDEATDLLGRLFADGDPASHFQVARWATADLVEAATRAGRGDEVDALMTRPESPEQADAAPRAAILARRARALLAGGPEAEANHRATGLGDAAETWPFEHARSQLVHGEWLRRRRRIVEARLPLRAALGTFERLGARPWAERARTELRAAGHFSRPSARPALDALTPQQMQITRLAAVGLSNGEIGERLFLSPRTVAYHLYNAYPKLQVTTRAQLAGALSSVGS